MKKIEDITIEQAKRVLPAWLEFLNSTSLSKLTAHPSVSKMNTIWMKYFAPVLDAAFYEKQIEIATTKSCNWISAGVDKLDNTEKFIPTCSEGSGKGIPFKNSGFLKYCPFCGKEIGWIAPEKLIQGEKL